MKPEEEDISVYEFRAADFDLEAFVAVGNVLKEFDRQVGAGLVPVAPGPPALYPPPARPGPEQSFPLPPPLLPPTAPLPEAIFSDLKDIFQANLGNIGPARYALLLAAWKEGAESEAGVPSITHCYRFSLLPNQMFIFDPNPLFPVNAPDLYVPQVDPPLEVKLQRGCSRDEQARALEALNART